MHCTEHYTIRTRLHTLAAAALSVAGLLLLPVANAQMNPPQAHPQAQSASPAISDAKLNAAAAAIRQVSSIQQSYQRKIEAAPSDKQRLTIEANDARRRRLLTRASPWMNTIALLARLKMTPRFAKSSPNGCVAQAIRCEMASINRMSEARQCPNACYRCRCEDRR